MPPTNAEPQPLSREALEQAVVHLGRGVAMIPARFLLFGTPEPPDDPEDARGDDEYFGRERAMGDS